MSRKPSRIALATLIALALMLAAMPRRSIAEGEPVTITSRNGTERELRTKAQLERLLEQHDVDPFIHTRTVEVVASVIPHSHPVLTVNTKNLESDLDLLSTFVHEQLHWLTSDRDEQVNAAIADFRERFTEVPVGKGEGARDEHSTYLHLIVCDLELQAMTTLVGKAAARETLAASDHYRWIYRQVLDNPKVREINTRHGFIVP